MFHFLNVRDTLLYFLFLLYYFSPTTHSRTTTHPTFTAKKMKWIFLTVFLACVVASRADDTYFEEEGDLGDARLGFITVGSDGSTSLTFNATSIQNAVIVGLFILVLGALLVPLFGAFDEETGYGYGYEQPSGYQTGYEQPSTGYSTYSKRYTSTNMLFCLICSTNCDHTRVKR